ncbi:MAG TPA: hypothetical protein PLD15_11220, partial [Mesotoga sp.]|nr:hypothetical protein [Mesotoga sp.]
EAAELLAPDLAPLNEVAARLRLEGGRLALEQIRARLGGGALEGTLGLDVAAVPPVLSGSLGLTGATLTRQDLWQRKFRRKRMRCPGFTRSSRKTPERPASLVMR